MTPIVRTSKSYSPSPLKIMGLYNSTLAQIDEFIREGIKQQERASPEDENKEERLDTIKYVGKCLNTSTSEEAADTKNNALFTLFFQCSCSTFSFFWYFFAWIPFFGNFLSLIYSPLLSFWPPTFILTPHLYLTRFSVWHLPLLTSNEGSRKSYLAMNYIVQVAFSSMQLIKLLSII